MDKGRLHVDRTDALLAFLVVVWGSAFAGIKALGEVLDPYQISWFRYAPFPVAYGLWLAWARRDTFRQVTGNDWVRMALLGAIGVLGYHIPLNWGLHDGGDGVSVTAATGAILIATTPLWTMAIAAATRQERPTLAAVLGSLVAFAGVAVVVFLGRGHVELTFARKALVVLVAPVCWAIYSVGSKPLVGKYGGLFTTGVTLSLGALTLLPLGIQYGAAPLHDLAPRHWVWLTFLALVSTILGYAIWNHALKQRSASQVAAWVYFNPVVAALVGYLFLGERITFWFVVGSLLVMGGVIAVNQARLAAARRAAQAAPPATLLAKP